jgi:hypothetical protein
MLLGEATSGPEKSPFIKNEISGSGSTLQIQLVDTIL